jgi:AraC family transcriptional regulator
MNTDITRAEYTSHINCVFDYIERNIDTDLSLEKLASVANFSPFHFHRIFKAMTGETLSRFIQRVRAEKAAVQLLGNPKKSITEIALDCGFSGSAAFARVFKEAFGLSASEWRKIRKEESNEDQTDSKHGKASGLSSMYFDSNTNLLTWRITMNNKQADVQVKDFAPMTVAYVRHVGPYKGDSKLFERLFGTIMKWAAPRGILGSPDMKSITVYHDDPDVTEADKLRLSVCVTVPEDTQTDGEIGKMTVAGGSYAVGRFELLSHEYEDAWKMMYGGWMPESGYQPDDNPPFELYLNDPDKHPEGRCIVEICIPVKPL